MNFRITETISIVDSIAIFFWGKVWGSLLGTFLDMLEQKLPTKLQLFYLFDKLDALGRVRFIKVFFSNTEPLKMGKSFMREVYTF